MKRTFQLGLVVLALLALASAGPGAQGGAQKPPDPKAAAAPAAPAATQKPADPPAELPAEAQAFNMAMAEKNPLKRVELLDKFLADNPKAAPMLLSMARSQRTSSLLAALKESQSKYQAVIASDLETAKKSELMPLYSTYNSIASRLLSGGVMLDEAEDYARKGLAAMNEPAYFEARKKQYERSLASYEKATAGAQDGAPAAAAPAPPPAPAGPNYTFAMKDGVTQAAIAPPRPAAPPRPPTPPRKPTMPTESEMRSSLKSERASALATFGQILMKRGKTDEGTKVLKEAFAARPSPATLAAVSRALLEPAKKAGNEAEQMEYLTVLVLSGRANADEFKEFDALYRKTHNGSADGMEAMLDARWHKDNVRFAVTPFTRPAGTKPTGRTVLAEVFPGAG
jgi:tetratricopeptide (TPR) repeat protein